MDNGGSGAATTTAAAAPSGPSGLDDDPQMWVAAMNNPLHLLALVAQTDALKRRPAGKKSGSKKTTSAPRGAKHLTSPPARHVLRAARDIATVPSTSSPASGGSPANGDAAAATNAARG